MQLRKCFFYEIIWYVEKLVILKIQFCFYNILFSVCCVCLRLYEWFILRIKLSSFYVSMI